jgi:glucokinase
MFLCADIGGTNTSSRSSGRAPFELVRIEKFSSPAVGDFAALAARFVGSRSIDGACLGVAGPIVGERVETTNLPWCIDGARSRAASAYPSSC